MTKASDNPKRTGGEEKNRPAALRRIRRGTQDSIHSDGARAGDVIGDFRLDSRLASGGQGEVWEATQTSLSRKVALKLVLPDRINEKTLALFAREARAGGRLSHPGIVAVHGYGEDDGRHWIAQELVEGSWTLRDFIDDVRKAEELPEDYYPAVTVFLAELADALQAAHNAGIIHRDVKPHNILVTPSDHPKLTDFGLARITDEVAMSLTGDFAGTWLYMSPEQVTAKHVEIDHRTDIFSLGVVMYEMLALVRPFDGDTTHQIAENIVMRDPPDLRKIRSRVPRDLAVICGKALEKAKDARFQSMAEFAADLRRHLAHEPINAQPPTLLDRGVKWVRRHPTKSLVSSSAAAAFVAISILTLHLTSQAEELELQKTALTESNAVLLSASGALAKKKDEAEASAVEASARAQEAQASARAAIRTAEDAERLSLTQNYIELVQEVDALWPARPNKIEAMKAWQFKAEALTTELPALLAKQNQLREQALPLTEEEARAQRESHPDFALLAPLHAEIDSKRRTLAVRRGEVELVLPEVDWSDFPTDANGLNKLAWPLLDPGRQSFGEEALGLVLATRAVELAPDDKRAEIQDSVAWGRFALGDDEAALSASRAALELAPADRRGEFAGYMAKLEAAVAAAQDFATTEARLSELDSRLAALTARVSERRHWTFPPEREHETRASWWDDVLSILIADLQALQSPETGLMSAHGVSVEHGWSVARRLASAERLAAGFAAGGEFLERWEAASAALAATYPGLDLPVQMGLVPLGPDPASRLWEFWHVESGTEPLRDEDGVLELEESSGLVLVLLPGGKFWMGAQAQDPDGPNYDEGAQSDESPVHEVELSAYFLSKYEMTQGQWKRLAGVNPSRDGPDGRNDTGWNAQGLALTLLEPVEQVSWFACVSLLDRVGLVLPSEAQWEYGCRAGTSSVYWSGDTKESLQGAANLPDAYAKEYGGGGWSEWELWLDDGYTTHAPVNTLRANDFGLHHVHGNVWEWCLDEYDGGFYERTLGVDPLNFPTASAVRVPRGGSFDVGAWDARSANRANPVPQAEVAGLGLRPAQGITAFSFTTSPSGTPDSPAPRRRP